MVDALRFRMEIIKSGRTQRDLAKAADVSEQKLSSALRGYKKLFPAEAAALEAVLGVPVPQAMIGSCKRRRSEQTAAEDVVSTA